MIKVENLSYGFPQKDLYHKISFTLEEGQHCAFIGTSGSGKSTLVDIIMDPESFMFDGLLEMDPASKIGYVSQFLGGDHAGHLTVFEFIGQTYLTLQAQMNSLCEAMATAEDVEPLLDRYQETLDAFDALGGDDFESLLMKKLNLANLGKHKDLRVSDLSGGEFKLVQVIKEMMMKPDVMIMDEPDVFLDFENLNALKDLMNAHKGSLLVITHNRYLLNHCFNKIIHLENTRLQSFDGRYIDYTFALLQDKIEKQELALADNEEIKRNEALIDRLRTNATSNSEASAGKRLKARVKIQERLQAKRVKMPFIELREPQMTLKAAVSPLTTLALSVEDYSVAFDEVLLEKVTFDIKPGEKVALIGPNGTGKTTLLRDIYTHNHPGIRLYEGVEMAYLSQSQGEVLKDTHSLYDAFYEVGFKSPDAIRKALSPYGFYGEQLDQKIGKLSGGEKNILQLAKVAASQANFLLLDEPTSHLDTASQIALEEAITHFDGAILMISHDYYTIAHCMDYVLMIEGKTIRKISMRYFRKMIYARHFDKDYLQIEQKKKLVERKINEALKATDFGAAKVLSEELEVLITQL